MKEGTVEVRTYVFAGLKYFVSGPNSFLNGDIRAMKDPFGVGYMEVRVPIRLVL